MESLTHLTSGRGRYFLTALCLASALAIAAWVRQHPFEYFSPFKSRVNKVHMDLDTLWKHIKQARGHSASGEGTLPNLNAYPQFPPPSPKELLLRSSHYNKLLNQREHLAPHDNPIDTPLFALYRLYEHLVLNRTIGLRNELERFWFNRWPVSSIPDPHDHSEPARYAVLACIPALMVLAFNKRIELGIPRHADAIMSLEEIDAYRNEEKVYESVPGWTLKVKPLEEVLKIPHDEGETLEAFDDERASPQLREKNILCWQPHIHFI